jgi:hypothetical protein
MSRLSKPLALAAIAGTALVLDACVIAPPNQSYPPGQGYGPAAPVDVSDLYNSAEGYARQQLYARGFRQVDENWSGRFNNTWWSNSNTRQCLVLETADSKVMSLNSRPPQDCRAPRGQ